MFTYRKAAQMAAALIDKQGGTINVLKLMKLMYLADRESLSRYGYPISFDNPVSMDHGPVLSTTLNLINGFIDEPGSGAWDEWITNRDGHDVSVKRNITRNDFDELSDADMDVINYIWVQFGKMDQWELRDYTHKYCAEWENPHHSSIPIEYKNILMAVGIDNGEAEMLEKEIEAEKEVDRFFANL